MADLKSYTISMDVPLAAGKTTEAVLNISGGRYLMVASVACTLQYLGPDNQTWVDSSILTQNTPVVLLVGQNASVRLKNHTGSAIADLDADISETTGSATNDVVIPGRGRPLYSVPRTLTASGTLATAGNSYVSSLIGMAPRDVPTITTNPGNRYKLTTDQSGAFLLVGENLVAGTDQLVISVAGINGGTLTSNLAITVGAALAISGAVTDVVAGDLFQFTPTVTGGTGAKRFELDTTANNLKIDKDTGKVTGYPDNLGNRRFNIRVIDAVGATQTLSQTLVVKQTSVVIAPTPQPSLTLSAPVVKPEGNSGTTSFDWTLGLNRDGSTLAYDYTWAVTPNGANPANTADFGGAFPSGSGQFTAAQTSKPLSVLVLGDTVEELAEGFLLTVVVAGVGSITSTGTISNDDVAQAVYAITSGDIAALMV